MTQTKKTNAGSNSKQSGRQHLHIMVVQRLEKGLGPGPVHVVKKILKEISVGAMVKSVRVPVPLDHLLPAGTGELTAGDRRTYAQQGLSAPEIAYVESKLLAKKVKSDVHRADFEAGKNFRLKESLKERLIVQLSADPQLAAEVVSSLNDGVFSGHVSKAAAPAPQAATLSEKVSRLLCLVVDVNSDIEVYKGRAKVGKSLNHEKLGAMLSSDAAQDWKLLWFALSQMFEQAAETPFARKKGWFSDQELSNLAVAHGFKSAPAAGRARGRHEPTPSVKSSP